MIDEYVLVHKTKFVNMRDACSNDYQENLKMTTSGKTWAQMVGVMKSVLVSYITDNCDHGAIMDSFTLAAVCTN